MPKTSMHIQYFLSKFYSKCTISYFRARENLVHVVQPLLDGIFAYMGLQAHLVLGVLPRLPGHPPYAMAYVMLSYS